MSPVGGRDVRLDMCDETAKARILGEGCTFEAGERSDAQGRPSRH
jgi:hypothetical protein